MKYPRFVSRTAAFGLLALSTTALPGCGGSKNANTTPEYEEKPIVHQVTAADQEAAHSKAPIQGDSAVLWVNGMGCPLCATNIDKQLERIRGVESVKVDLGEGKVLLGFKPSGERPSPARLSTAVEDAGFTLVKVEGR